VARRQTETVEDLVARIDLNAEWIPKFARWQAMLLSLDAGFDTLPASIENLEYLEFVAGEVERLSPLVEALPDLVGSEREAVLIALDAYLTRTLAFVNQQRATLMGDDVRAEREAVLAAITEERIAVLEAIAEERSIVLDTLRAERAAAFEDLDALMDEAFTREVNKMFVRGLILVSMLLIVRTRADPGFDATHRARGDRFPLCPCTETTEGLVCPFDHRINPLRPWSVEGPVAVTELECNFFALAISGRPREKSLAGSDQVVRRLAEGKQAAPRNDLPSRVQPRPARTHKDEVEAVVGEQRRGDDGNPAALREPNYRDVPGRRSGRDQAAHLIGNLGGIHRPVGAGWACLRNHHETPFGKDLQDLLILVYPEHRMGRADTGTLDNRTMEVEEVAGIGVNHLRHLGKDLQRGFS